MTGLLCAGAAAGTIYPFCNAAFLADFRAVKRKNTAGFREQQQSAARQPGDDGDTITADAVFPEQGRGNAGISRNPYVPALLSGQSADQRLRGNRRQRAVGGILRGNDIGRRGKFRIPVC